jgi:tRNA-Thr(GGU) m(6)t(6)A37 methyltransferase TsaA
MAENISLAPIGYVRSSRAEPIDDDWDAVESRIELDAARFQPDACAGLEAFSHVEVVYHFHRVEDAEIVRGARHPRGRKDWPRVGIFAQRAKGRPNRLGVTVAKLERVDGLTLVVRGLDAIDGTPVLDVKPCMRAFQPRGDVREPTWATELMQNYW